jgi:hypothetical protein
MFLLHIFMEIIGNKTKTKTIQEIINSRKITFEKFGDKTKLLMLPRDLFRNNWINNHSLFGKIDHKLKFVT